VILLLYASSMDRLPSQRGFVLNHHVELWPKAISCGCCSILEPTSPLWKSLSRPLPEFIFSSCIAHLFLAAASPVSEA
jgi:hypothetical protein